MPIQESYKRVALERVERLGKVFEHALSSAFDDVEPEDFEFGVSLELNSAEAENLWKECVEENNYMEVVFTEIMEHHDGAYLKATFRNSAGNYFSDRYVSIRSSGRVEITYAFFVLMDGLRVRIERLGEGRFKAYAKKE